MTKPESQLIIRDMREIMKDHWDITDDLTPVYSGNDPDCYRLAYTRDRERWSKTHGKRQTPIDSIYIWEFSSPVYKNDDVQRMAWSFSDFIISHMTYDYARVGPDAETLIIKNTTEINQWIVDFKPLSTLVFQAKNRLRVSTADLELATLLRLRTDTNLPRLQV